jgi:signal peptidase I
MLAIRMLERLGPRYRREALAGDLVEEVQRGRTAMWLWSQVLRIIWTGIDSTLRDRGRRLAGSFAVASAALLGRRPPVAATLEHGTETADGRAASTSAHTAPPPMPRRLRSYWQDYRGFAAFLLLMLGFRSAWADWVYVPTGSMNPTILEGDRLLVDKHIYGLRVPFSLVHLTWGEDPARGDIILFRSPADGKQLVKRVIAVPGDTVAMHAEQLVVNGVAATYAPGEARELQTLLAATRAHDPSVLLESGIGVAHDILLLPDRWTPSTFGPMVIPRGKYFVLGDNRDNSADSRYIGLVPRRNIFGRATRVIVSLNPDRYYLPRSARLLKSLY